MKKYQLFLVTVFSLLILSSSNSFSQYYYNKAASFNGTTSYIAIPNDAELNPTTAITIETWVYPKNLGCVTFVGKRYTNNYWFGSCNSGRLRFYPKGGSSVDGTASLPLNKWSHIAATYDGAATKFYINGQLDFSSTTITGPIVPNTDSLFIGADVTGYFYNGYMDNVRLWNVARTATQIQNNMYITLQMNKPTGNYTGLVATYNLDWDASDWSGTTRNNGFLRNITLIDLNGKPVNYVDYNSALVLDGNSYCAIENHIEFNATTAITLEAWIKRNLSLPQPSAQFIIDKSHSSGWDYALWLTGSTLSLSINTSLSVSVSQSNAVTDDSWHHVSATYSSVDGKAALYVDGNQIQQVTVSGNPTIPNTVADSLFIGGTHPSSSDAANKFKGQIDEVRIWKDVVRTQAEIKSEMFVTRGNYNSPAGGFTYTFNDYTNYARTPGNGHLTYPLNFRGNAYISSSRLQNDYTSPILATNDPNLLTGFNISTNRTTIPTGGTATDSVNITTAGNVNSLQAFVLLNHGAVGKVSMSLISPTGVTVNLLPAQNAALTDHDIMTIFDPAADSTISFTTGLKAPFSPRVKPFGNFTSFNGSKANEIWKLRITDATTGTMLRILNGWGLKLGVVVGVNDKELPTKFELNQNYPNPFNPSTVISYQLPVGSFVTLKVFDILGREVATLVNEYQQAGTHNSTFSTLNSALTSGVYFYTLTTPNFTATKKLVLIK